MSYVIVFDVNETLLDLNALNPHFERIFGDAGVKQKWFGQVLQSAMVTTMTGIYTDFGSVGRHALKVTAMRQGVELSDEELSQIVGGMLTLPPHPEVPDSLARLQNAGLRLAALTNSATKAVHAQLTNAGIIDYFDQVYSVEEVQRFKPDPKVYQMAASKLNIDLSNMLMVAAHDWDVTGAIRAGCAGAFIARPGMVLGPLSEVPDIVGKDLSEVADKILETNV